MNLIDCVVTAVAKELIYEAYGRWWVPVLYEAYGRQGNSEIMCKSEEDALKVDVGFEFLA